MKPSNIFKTLNTRPDNVNPYYQYIDAKRVVDDYERFIWTKYKVFIDKWITTKQDCNGFEIVAVVITDKTSVTMRYNFNNRQCFDVLEFP